MKATQRLYRTADGEICSEDDPRVAFVLATPGKEIPKEYEAKVKAWMADHGDDVDDEHADEDPSDNASGEDADAAADDADEEAPAEQKRARKAPNKRAPRARNK